MESEFNLNIEEAIDVIFDGGMIVGENFASGILAKVNSFGIVGLFLYLNPEDRSPRERDFLIRENTFKAKYKKINNISEAFKNKD